MWWCNDIYVLHQPLPNLAQKAMMVQIILHYECMCMHQPTQCCQGFGKVYGLIEFCIEAVLQLVWQKTTVVVMCRGFQQCVSGIILWSYVPEKETCTMTPLSNDIVNGVSLLAPSIWHCYYVLLNMDLVLGSSFWLRLFQVMNRGTILALCLRKIGFSFEINLTKTIWKRWM